MNLRQKTLVMIGATLLALVLILFAISEIFLISGLGNLENQNLIQDVNRAQNAINQELNTLNSLVEDWASWDDSYDFVRNNNSNFIDNNLANSTFSSLKLNLILFLDFDGNVVYVKTVDSQGNAGYTLPSGMQNYISNSSSSLIIKNDSQSVKGLINLDGGPMMVVARPILTSDSEGPYRGTLIMGRYLDSRGIGTISNVTQLSLAAVDFRNDPGMNSDFKTAKQSIINGQKIAIKTLGYNSIAGYTLMFDINGNPSMILRVNETRSLFNEGQTSIYYFILMLLVAGVVMGASILFYLDKAVLSRLSSLSNNIRTIGKSKDFSARVPVEGDDELTHLSKSINKMMRKLENSHISLLKNEKKFRQLAENIEEVFWIFDVKKGIFLYLSPAYENIWGHKPESACKEATKWLDYVHPDDKDILKEFFPSPSPHVIKGDHIAEYRIITKENDVKWIRSRFSIISNKKGEVNSIMGISEEITQRKKHEKELQKTKNRLDFLISATPAIIYTVDCEPPFKTNFISDNVGKILGYDSEDFLNDPYFWTKHVYPDDISQAISDMDLLMQRGLHTYEYRFKTADGSYKWIRDDANIVKDDQGKAIEIAGYWIDITERKAAEKAVEKSEKIYRTIFENTGTATAMIEKDLKISLVNTEFEKLSGYSKEEIEGKWKFTEFMGNNECEKVIKYHKENLKTSGMTHNSYETQLCNSEGNMRSIMVTIALIPETERTLASIIDITEHKDADNKIRSSLKEKEILLRELHHRVKNNLQVISSLLSLQSRYIQDEEVLEIFKESQNRVKSMTLVHEKLYQSEDVSKVDFKEYINELSSVLFRSYGTSISKVSLSLEIEDILVDLNTAIPLGLIINELLTNALKHAFPSNREGEIKVSFQKTGSDKFVLEVADNGVGIPENLDIMNSKSLGLRLVRTLTDQLDGELEIETVHGTRFKITF